MNRIIRLWNQNRKGLIVGILAIVLVILLVQILNQIAKEQKQKRANIVIENKIDEQLPTKSIITGEKVNTEVTQNNVDIIQEFITYCNEGKTSEAYQLLTKECKRLVYPTEELFIKEYYNLIFTKSRLCKIDNFKNSSNTYTYEVKFYNDALSQGKVDNTGIYTDYITVDTKQEEGKLNINGFIRSKEINKKVEQNGIEITLLEQEIYKNSQKYTVKIENKTEKNILLDTRTKNRSVYITGNNDATYSAFMNQVPTNLLQINSKISRTYTIQFNKIYDPSVVIRAISFTDIVSDSDTYQVTPDKIKERISIKLEF